MSHTLQDWSHQRLNTRALSVVLALALGGVDVSRAVADDALPLPPPDCQRRREGVDAEVQRVPADWRRVGEALRALPMSCRHDEDVCLLGLESSRVCDSEAADQQLKECRAVVGAKVWDQYYAAYAKERCRSIASSPVSATLVVNNADGVAAARGRAPLEFFVGEGRYDVEAHFDGGLICKQQWVLDSKAEAELIIEAASLSLSCPVEGATVSIDDGPRRALTPTGRVELLVCAGKHSIRFERDGVLLDVRQLNVTDAPGNVTCRQPAQGWGLAEWSMISGGGLLVAAVISHGINLSRAEQQRNEQRQLDEARVDPDASSTTELDRRQRSNNERLRAVETWDAVNLGVGVTGALVAAGGVVWWLAEPEDANHQTPSGGNPTGAPQFVWTTTF